MSLNIETPRFNSSTLSQATRYEVKFNKGQDKQKGTANKHPAKEASSKHTTQKDDKADATKTPVNAGNKPATTKPVSTATTAETTTETTSVSTDTTKPNANTATKIPGEKTTTTTTTTEITSPVQKIKYAPARKPNSGTIEMCCVSLKWQDAKPVDLGSVSSMCRSVKNVYERLSGGKIKINVTSKMVPVSSNKAKKNLNRAEQEAKRNVSARGKKYDLYAYVNGGVLDYEHAGGDTIHLSGTLDRTAYHETGHTKLFGLGHAGLIDLKTNKYDSYGDRSSFMGRYSTTNINAPQMYFEGWLAEDKVAQSDIATAAPGAPDEIYKLEPLFSSTSSDAVKGVLIPRTEGRNMFLSLRPGSDNLPVLNLIINNGASTAQVGPNFGKELKYGGLVFTRIAVDGVYSTMKISQESKMPTATGNADEKSKDVKAILK